MVMINEYDSSLGAPTSNSADGKLGEVRMDDQYVYICKGLGSGTPGNWVRIQYNDTW